MPNRIAEWGFICEKASFDSGMRLNVTGLVRDLLVDTLPFGFEELCLVIALGPPPNTAPNEVKIALAVRDPAGAAVTPIIKNKRSVDIRVQNDFLLVTLYAMPVLMEGTYRFAVSVNGEQIVELQLPVSVAASSSERRH